MTQNIKPKKIKNGVSPELRAKFGRFREHTLDVLIRTGNYSKRRVAELCEDPDGKAIELVVARTYLKAMEGSEKHIRELFDRILGPIIQTLIQIDNNGDEDRPKKIDADTIYNALVKLKQEKPDEECKLITIEAKPNEVTNNAD